MDGVRPPKHDARCGHWTRQVERQVDSVDPRIARTDQFQHLLGATHHPMGD